MERKSMTLDQILKKKRKPQVKFTEEEKRFIAHTINVVEMLDEEDIRLSDSIDAKLQKAGW